MQCGNIMRAQWANVSASLRWTPDTEMNMPVGYRAPITFRWRSLKIAALSEVQQNLHYSAVKSKTPHDSTKVYNYQCAYKPLTICYFCSLFSHFRAFPARWNKKGSYNSGHPSLTGNRKCAHILNADMFYVKWHDLSWDVDFCLRLYRLKRRVGVKQRADSHMYNLWQCSKRLRFSVSELQRCFPRVWQKSWFIPQDEVVSAALCSCKHRGESTQRTAWGKIYTGETRWDH